MNNRIFKKVPVVVEFPSYNEYRAQLEKLTEQEMKVCCEALGVQEQPTQEATYQAVYFAARKVANEFSEAV